MLTPEQFLRDVERHELTVLREDGVYRHLRFKRPDSGCMRFDLVTWPGLLCFTGDMGTFVFSRLEDMLEFFRRPASRPMFDMDMRYWAEKCQAQDASGPGVREFDPDRFRREITVQRRSMLVRYGRDMQPSDRVDLCDLLEDVRRSADDSEWRAFAAADAFSFSWTGEGRKDRRLGLALSEFPTCKTYTFHFRWCCFALAWGIDLYDKAKAAAAEAQPRVSAEG